MRSLLGQFDPSRGRLDQAISLCQGDRDIKCWVKAPCWEIESPFRSRCRQFLPTRGALEYPVEHLQTHHARFLSVRSHLEHQENLDNLVERAMLRDDDRWADSECEGCHGYSDSLKSS
ncbi:hypothetical protein X992_5479 [Burkholderia pseudomallei MSHR5492]|nr:hypothetical protein X992_5479 [Burkholderia pseudomallei MSHR5492]